jgi:hypothetical protein
MALPKGEVPEQLASLAELAAIYKIGEALDTWSRRNWLFYAVDLCASHYGFPRLSYLNQQAAVLNPIEANLAAQELSSLLIAIKEDPASLSELLGQDAWSIHEIKAMLHVQASPWGPLVETDDGDELPYLLSFLVSQLALLQHAIDRNLYVAFAQSPDA